MTRPPSSDAAARAYEIVWQHPEGVDKCALAKMLGYKDTHSMGSVMAALGLYYPVYVDGRRVFAVRAGDDDEEAPV